MGSTGSAIMAKDIEDYSVSVGLDQQLGATLRAAPGDSDSGIAVVEHTLPPGKLAAPLHRHANEDEISYIISGVMGVQEGPLGGDESVSTHEAGSVVVKERDVWHTFWNPGPEPLRFLEIIAPGAFAGYFAETADILGDDGLSEAERRQRLQEVGERYEFELTPESVPELIARHGLDS